MISPSDLYLSICLTIYGSYNTIQVYSISKFLSNWSVPFHLNSVIFLPILTGPNSFFVISRTTLPVTVRIWIFMF